MENLTTNNNTDLNIILIITVVQYFRSYSRPCHQTYCSALLEKAFLQAG